MFQLPIVKKDVPQFKIGVEERSNILLMAKTNDPGTLKQRQQFNIYIKLTCI